MLDPGLASSVLKRNIQGYIESIGDGVGRTDSERVDMGVRVNERMIERFITENILPRIVITKENGRFPMPCR